MSPSTEGVGGTFAGQAGLPDVDVIGVSSNHDGGGSAAVERYTLPEYDCLFPIISLTIMAEVLAGAHGPAPVALVAYHCSGVLRDRV